MADPPQPTLPGAEQGHRRAEHRQAQGNGGLGRGMLHLFHVTEARPGVGGQQSQAGQGQAEAQGQRGASACQGAAKANHRFED